MTLKVPMTGKSNLKLPVIRAHILTQSSSASRLNSRNVNKAGVGEHPVTGIGFFVLCRHFFTVFSDFNFLAVATLAFFLPFGSLALSDTLILDAVSILSD